MDRRCLPIAALSAALLLAGATQSGASTDDVPPGMIISGRTKVKPKPKLVRHALEARYAEIREAYRVKDPDVVLRMRTENFHAVMPSGETWDAATSAQYTRAGFAQVESTLALTFELGMIEVQGDTAAAEIDQHWVRRQQKAGALRHVDTRAHQRETWLNRNGTWLLWRVDHVQPGRWIVDGKRIDPSKPYDPKAPAYEQPGSDR
jgi:ketosteroid isomerase-like protein